jgi:hypothetical protein
MTGRQVLDLTSFSEADSNAPHIVGTQNATIELHLLFTSFSLLQDVCVCVCVCVCALSH